LFQVEKMNFDKLAPGPLSTPVAPNSMHPPVSLLQFTPLALFCNAQLSAFNALRLNAPLALAPLITNLVQNSLLSASKAILARYRQEELAFSSTEQQGVQRLCTCFADDFVPHMQKCLQSLFPVVGIAANLGLSSQQIQRDGIGFLDKNEIIDPIRHLLPVQIEPLSLITPTKPKEEAPDSIQASIPDPQDIDVLDKTENNSQSQIPDQPSVEETNSPSLFEIGSNDNVSDVSLVPVKFEMNEDLMATSSESFDMCNSKGEEIASSTSNGIADSIEKNDLSQQ
jgi:hypothetical protein